VEKFVPQRSWVLPGSRDFRNQFERGWVKWGERYKPKQALARQVVEEAAGETR
jgi:hypothetical protein